MPHRTTSHAKEGEMGMKEGAPAKKHWKLVCDKPNANLGNMRRIPFVGLTIILQS